MLSYHKIQELAPFKTTLVERLAPLFPFHKVDSMVHAEARCLYASRTGKVHLGVFLLQATADVHLTQRVDGGADSTATHVCHVPDSGCDIFASQKKKKGEGKKKKKNSAPMNNDTEAQEAFQMIRHMLLEDVKLCVPNP